MTVGVGIGMLGFSLGMPLAAMADSVSVDFETPTYTIGNINGQDGWMKTGTFDVAVSSSLSTVGFGAQSLRISDAVTSGSFSDQTFAKPLTDSAGETASTAGTFSVGTKQPHFEMQFDIASTKATVQPGMHITASPDRGDGSRMSYLRFEDQADGIHAMFDDVQGLVSMGVDGCTTSVCGNFVETDVATISRTPHTIKLAKILWMVLATTW